MLPGKCEEMISRNNSLSPASHLSVQVLAIFQHLTGIAKGFSQRPYESSQQETIHIECYGFANPSVKCLTLTISFNPRELSVVF